MVLRYTFQGALEISAMIDGYLVGEQYFGFTKAAAIKKFKQDHGLVRIPLDIEKIGHPKKTIKGAY